MGKTTTVGQYLIRRLLQRGVKHVFGVPGDYVLGFYDQMVESRIETVGTVTEAGAAFAADAYARVNGLGAVCVTYCVGGFNTLNPIAGTYAEKSPVVLISGAPGLDQRATHPLLHHRVRDFDTQLKIFEKVTVASAALEDPDTAPDQIDAVLAACIRAKRPVYLELPRDIVSMKCRAPGKVAAEEPKSDPATLGEALAEAEAMLRKAKRPAILAGVEIHRFGLQESILKLVEKSGYPVAATLLGKSVITERHAQYVGVYEGAMGREDVRREIERADCLLILGAFMTDINLGVYTARLDVAKTINATSETTAIKHHHFDKIELKDFINGLARITARHPRRKAVKRAEQRPFKPQPSRAVTVRRFFKRMNDFLGEDMMVIADIGDSLFGAADLTIHRRTEFLSPAYYTSMGFAIPAALGAQVARPDLRPVVFVGDGAFQMTSQELSIIARRKLNPIIFLLNNKGYTTERYINEGPYNDIQEWAYHRMPDLLGAGWGCEVRTEAELEVALEQAKAHTLGFSILNVHLDPLDRSVALERLGRRLAKQGGFEPGKKTR